MADHSVPRLVYELHQEAQDGQAQTEVDVEDAPVGGVLAERPPVYDVRQL